MTAFIDYYRGPFRRDLARVVAAMESPHSREAAGVVIQPLQLSTENPVIRDWSAAEQMLFGSGLYLTILADEVCYTHFRPDYEGFRRLTQYPKFRGDCPGGCYSHQEPYVVFEMIGKPKWAGPEMRGFDLNLFPESFSKGMEAEIRQFCREYMPLRENDFWMRCHAEIRFLYVHARTRAAVSPTPPMTGEDIERLREGGRA
jgi:hypothetical protein